MEEVEEDFGEKKLSYDPVCTFPLPISELSIEELTAKYKEKGYLSYWEKYKLFFAPDTALTRFCEQLVGRSRIDTDTIIAVSGNRGIGKSSLAVLISRHLAYLLGCRPFSLKDDIIYYGTPNEVYEKMFGEKNKSVPVVADEVLTFASKHKWQSKENLSFEDSTLLSRVQNKAVFLVGPRLMDMSEVFRNQRVILNLEILERGKAALFKRYPSTQVSDPWFIKKIETLIVEQGRKFITATPYEKQLFYEKNVPTFVEMIYYPKLDAPTDRAYKALSMAMRMSVVKPKEEKVSEAELKSSTSLLWFNLFSKGMSIDDIAVNSGIDAKIVSRRINLLAKQKLKETVNTAA